jgi:hypothetical protein
MLRHCRSWSLCGRVVRLSTSDGPSLRLPRGHGWQKQCLRAGCGSGGLCGNRQRLSTGSQVVTSPELLSSLRSRGAVAEVDVDPGGEVPENGGLAQRRRAGCQPAARQRGEDGGMRWSCDGKWLLPLCRGLMCLTSQHWWAGPAGLVPAPVPLPARVVRRGVHTGQRGRGSPCGDRVPRATVARGDPRFFLKFY